MLQEFAERKKDGFIFKEVECQPEELDSIPVSAREFLYDSGQFV